MDLSALLTPPVFVAAFVLAIVSAWVGIAIGRSREAARKASALAEADNAHKTSLASLRGQFERKLDALAKTGAEEKNDLRQMHAAQIERVGSEHAELIAKLNDANNAHLSEIRKDQERQISEVEQRQAAEIERVRTANAEAVQALRAEHGQALEALEREHQSVLRSMREEREAVEAERDSLAGRVAELSQTIDELNHQIKESRLNNMFSVSKSGEKLIRVVRSVQELATELDETSRAVTDGAYSFFAEIKDKRDKETVLSLARGDRADAGEGAAAEGPVIENEVPPEQEAGGAERAEPAAEADSAGVEGVELDADAEISGEADLDLGPEAGPESESRAEMASETGQEGGGAADEAEPRTEADADAVKI